jgi:hypothetical protein
MDALRRDDIERARRLTGAERWRAVFDAVEDGIALRRAALRARHPSATDAALDEMVSAWLLEDRDD